MFVDPAHEAGALWVESMHQLYTLIRRVNEGGGIHAVCDSWNRPTKILLAAELERIVNTLDGWTSQLHEGTDENRPRLAP